MRIKIQIITTLVLFLAAGNAFTQSITVPTETVNQGGTATVVLSYATGGGVNNFNFRLYYDDNIVDESELSLGVSCDSAAIAISSLTCSVDTVLNRISGIGVNLGGALVSGNFATVTLPTLGGAAFGDSVNNIEITFAAGVVGTSADSTWTLTVAAALLDQTITSFTSTPAILTFPSGDGQLAAVADSGLTVTDFGVQSGPCTVSGSTVTPTGAGVCVVTADQAGSASYNPAPQETLNITVIITEGDSDGDGIPDVLDNTPNTADPNFCTDDNTLLSGIFVSGTQTVCRADVSITTDTNLLIENNATLVLIAPDVFLPDDFTAELGSILLISQPTPP